MANKRKRRVGLRLFLILIAVVLLLLVGFGFLFDINEIIVNGAYDHSPDDIIATSEITVGRNLFFFSKSAAEKKILAAYPYISFVTVERELPGTVRISVSEGVVKAAVQYVYTEDEVEYTGEYVIDENCRMTEEAQPDGEYIEVNGLVAEKSRRGSVIAVSNEDETRLSFTQAILNRLGDDGYSPDVTWVDVSNISSITFDYMGRYTVNVGSGEDLEYKLSRLDGIVSQLDASEKGVIDLSEEGKAFFVPEKQVVTTQITETDAE